MHSVRVHRRRLALDDSEASRRVSTDDDDASAEASNDTSEESEGEPDATPTTPPDLGLEPCPNGCGGWFEGDDAVAGHVASAHAPAPEPAPPSEDHTVREVAEGLPSPLPFGLTFGSDRLSRVRRLLAESRRKANRHPDDSDDKVVSRFWDPSERAILESLRGRGVNLRASPDTVRDEANGG